MRRSLIPSFQLAVLAFALALVGCKAESGEAEVVQPEALPGAAVPSPVLSGTNGVAATEAVTPAPKLATAPEKLSAGIHEIVELAERGVGEDVILAFISNWPQRYNLTAEEIVYLTDLGIPESVISAMIKHSGSIASAANKPQPESVPPASATQAPVPEAQQPVATPSQPSVSVAATPEFDAGVQAQAPAQQPVQVVQPAPVVQYNVFYSSLAPYGSWFYVQDYGYCWRPTVAVVSPGWQPYSDRGRWLYSDHGWYWQSDYSWGWAPFHYGRWWSHPSHGWVWMPDTTWGPAWVTWRYSDSYCGWAPLPPGAHYREGFGFSYYGSRVSLSFDFGLRRNCYTFVPIDRFCDRTPWRHRVRHGDSVNVYNRTRIVNNIQVINNNTVINHGVSRDTIARASRAEVPTVAVRNLPSDGGRMARPDRLNLEGKETVVYRPQLPVAPAEVQGGTRRPPEGVNLVSSSGNNNAIATPLAPTAAPAAGTESISLSGSRSRAEFTGKPIQDTSGLRSVSAQESPSGSSVIRSRNSSLDRAGEPVGGASAPSTMARPIAQPSAAPVAGSPSANNRVGQATAVQSRSNNRVSTAPLRPSAPPSQPPVSKSLQAANSGVNSSADATAGQSRARSEIGAASEVRESSPQLIRTPVSPGSRREWSRSVSVPITPSRPPVVAAPQQAPISRSIVTPSQSRRSAEISRNDNGNAVSAQTGRVRESHSRAITVPSIGSRPDNRPYSRPTIPTQANAAQSPSRAVAPPAAAPSPAPSVSAPQYQGRSWAAPRTAPDYNPAPRREMMKPAAPAYRERSVQAQSPYAVSPRGIPSDGGGRGSVRTMPSAPAAAPNYSTRSGPAPAANVPSMRSYSAPPSSGRSPQAPQSQSSSGQPYSGRSRQER